MNKNSRNLLAGIIIVILVVIGVYSFTNRQAVSESYTEEDFDFVIDIPSDWVYRDDLTVGKCCLFVAYWTTSTTTALNASGTPQEKVTVTERVKLQIGYYYKSVDDPFKSASTTKVTLGKNEFFKGNSQGVEFYLLPRNDEEGLGVALFSYIETTEEEKEAARNVIGTIELLPHDAPATATSTATTTKQLE